MSIDASTRSGVGGRGVGAGEAGEAARGQGLRPVYDDLGRRRGPWVGSPVDHSTTVLGFSPGAQVGRH